MSSYLPRGLQGRLLSPLSDEVRSLPIEAYTSLGKFMRGELMLANMHGHSRCRRCVQLDLPCHVAIDLDTYSNTEGRAKDCVNCILVDNHCSHWNRPFISEATPRPPLSPPMPPKEGRPTMRSPPAKRNGSSLRQRPHVHSESRNTSDLSPNNLPPVNREPDERPSAGAPPGRRNVEPRGFGPDRTHPKGPRPAPYAHPTRGDRYRRSPQQESYRPPPQQAANFYCRLPPLPQPDRREIFYSPPPPPAESTPWSQVSIHTQLTMHAETIRQEGVRGQNWVLARVADELMSLADRLRQLHSNPTPPPPLPSPVVPMWQLESHRPPRAQAGQEGPDAYHPSDNFRLEPEPRKERPWNNHWDDDRYDPRRKQKSSKKWKKHQEWVAKKNKRDGAPASTRRPNSRSDRQSTIPTKAEPLSPTATMFANPPPSLPDRPTSEKYGHSKKTCTRNSGASAGNSKVTAKCKWRTQRTSAHTTKKKDAANGTVTGSSGRSTAISSAGSSAGPSAPQSHEAITPTEDAQPQLQTDSFSGTVQNAPSVAAMAGIAGFEGIVLDAPPVPLRTHLQDLLGMLRAHRVANAGAGPQAQQALGAQTEDSPAVVCRSADCSEDFWGFDPSPSFAPSNLFGPGGSGNMAAAVTPHGQGGSAPHEGLAEVSPMFHLPSSPLDNPPSKHATAESPALAGRAALWRKLPQAPGDPGPPKLRGAVDTDRTPESDTLDDSE